MTHQSQLEAERESYRQLVQIATKPNTLRIGYANGIAVPTRSRAKSAATTVTTGNQNGTMVSASTKREAQHDSSPA
jgi:hypothetical protein